MNKKEIDRMRLRGLDAQQWAPENLRLIIAEDYGLIDGTAKQMAKETMQEFDERQKKWAEAQLKKAIGASIDVAKAIVQWYPSAGVFITFDPFGLCSPFGIELRYYGSSKKDKVSTDYDPMLATE